MVFQTLGELPSLAIDRHYPVAPEKVWNAWTRPEEMKLWLRPTTIVALPIVEIDLRVGGRFRILMLGQSGSEHDAGGAYTEIEANRKLVFTWVWKKTPEQESLVTLTFKAAGKGTDFRLAHERLADEATRDDHRGGWSGAMDSLEKYFA